MRSLQTDGYLIRFKRESQGKSLGPMASRVGITAGYLSRIEQGLRNPTPPITAAIAAELGCSIEDITVSVMAS